MPTNRRILLCRLGFVLLCVFPTLVTCGWLTSQSIGRPAGMTTKEDWQRELTSRLGLRVEIERVEPANRDAVSLLNVRLLEPETGEVVAQAAAIEIAKLADGWTVSAEGAVIEVGQLGLLVRTLDHRILRGPPPAGSSESYWAVALFPSDVALHGVSQSQTLLGLAGTFSFSADSSKLQLDFRLPDSTPEAKSGRFTVVRKRSDSPPETEWSIDTGGQAFPCEMLHDLLPPLASLGPDSAFQGHAGWVVSPLRPSGGIAGTISGVDFDTLITEQFPHQLSGRGKLEIERAAIRSGKLTELAGTLHVEHGSISPSLVAALAEHLQLDSPLELHEPTTSRPIPFGKLGVQFHLDGRSLRLKGVASESEPGVLIASAAGPILAASPQHATSPVNLLRALLPDNQYQVPATRQTGALVNLLPVPDLAPARTASLPKHTPTRLRTSGPPDTAPVLRQPMLR